jgi:tetratricopeptide (TPR) repeat protein
MRIFSPGDFPRLDLQDLLQKRVYEIPVSFAGRHERFRLVRLVQHSLPQPCPLWRIDGRHFGQLVRQESPSSTIAGLHLPSHALLWVEVERGDQIELALNDDAPEGWAAFREALRHLPVRLVIIDWRAGPPGSQGEWYETTLTKLASETFQKVVAKDSLLETWLDPDEIPWPTLESLSSNVLEYYDIFDDVLQRRQRSPKVSWQQAVEDNVIDSLRHSLASVATAAARYLLEITGGASGPELPDLTEGRLQRQTWVAELLHVGLLRKAGGRGEDRLMLPPRLAFVLERPHLLSMLRREQGPDESNARIASSLEPVLAPLLEEEGNHVPIQSLGDLRRRVDSLRGAEGADALARIVFRHIENSLDEAAQRQNAGHVALAQGDHTKALRLYTEALRVHLSVQDHEGASADFGYLGRVAMAAHLPDRAVMFYESALNLHRRVNDEWGAFLDLQSQAKAFMAHGHHAVAGLAGLQAATVLGRTIADASADRPQRMLDSLLDRLAKDDPQEHLEISRLLKNDAEGLRRQGIRHLLRDTVLAVSFYEDELTVARAFNDVEAACSALGHQALALAEADQLRAAAAGLRVAEQVMATAPPPGPQMLQERLDQWRGEFHNILADAKSLELQREIADNPESLRAQAVADMLPLRPAEA